MLVIFYTEPDTKIRYERGVSKAEADDIATANPMHTQRIDLRDTGGTISFDGRGQALIISSVGKKSSANAHEFVEGAKQALKDNDDL